MMRISASGVAALLLACLAWPALAADYPRLAPGLWEMDREADRAGGPPNRVTMCLDESVEKEMVDMGTGAMNGMCSKHEFHFSGNRGSGEFVCDMGGSTMHSKSTMTLDGNRAYRTEIDTTYDPPFMGRTKSRTVVTARNVGPCKAGQYPGDLVLPNGTTMNMREMMKGTTRPGARPPQ